jgi:hypothetical protein
MPILPEHHENAILFTRGYHEKDRKYSIYLIAPKPTNKKIATE